MDETKYGWWLPMDVSTHGSQIDSLISTVHWFMLLLFVGWGIYFVYVLAKFRARAGRTAQYAPIKASFSKYIEGAVVVFEAFLLFGLSSPIWARYKNTPPKAGEALEIHVVAQQFAWNIHYAGKDGKFGRTAPEFVTAENAIGLDPNDPDGKDDIVTVNQLHFPVHKPVIVTLSSKDVIHSFNIPVLRVKQDTVPGARIPVWFEATETGHFELACAQLCGNSHYNMRADVLIDTPADYDKFIAEYTPAVAAPTPSAQGTPGAPGAPGATGAATPQKQVTEKPQQH